MSQSNFVVNVSEADFEYEVLAYSQQVPVVVDFWAEWCGPCRILGPTLEKLAAEAQGAFRLAKVNVDENPNLAVRFDVRGIPVVKAFRDGRVVSEFVGAQPEPRVREFIKSIAPGQSDLALEKATSLLDQRQPMSAELTFREVLESHPDHPVALLGLARSLMLQGTGEEAASILSRFPASKEFSKAELLRPLAEVMQKAERDDLEGDNMSPLDAAFIRSVRLVGRGNLEAALDGLLDILREDKRFRKGEARQVYLAILELMDSDSPTARQYRSELASVLF